MRPGVYYNLPYDEYRAAPGLSNSAMKDLAVSPLRFWHRHVNPNRPAERQTEFLEFGHALHCAVLEPDTFTDRFACELTPGDGCLVKAEDLKGWLKDHGIPPKGTTKTGWIEQVQAADPEAPIFDVMFRRYLSENAGKTMLSRSDYERVYSAALALRDEPKLRPVLTEGKAEVSIFAEDPDTGVMLKARLDWMHHKSTLDLKTFTQKRGKSIDETVADALYYEGYLRQAWLYSHVRKLATGEGCPFIFAFVESEMPHEVRIKELRPKNGGLTNVFWETSRVQVQATIRQYAACVERFGNSPWREEQDIEELRDDEIRALAY